MNDLLDDLARWAAEGQRAVLARVVDVEGSGPRAPGAAMAVAANGEVAGSVSGGCVESAVVAESLDVLDTGAARLVTFGYSDDDAFAVGLTCGGTVRLLLLSIDRLAPGLIDAFAAAVRSGRPVALVTVVDGPDAGRTRLVLPQDPRHTADAAARGDLADARLAEVADRDAQRALAAGRSELRHYGDDGEAARSADADPASSVSVFIDVFVPPPRLIVFGAVDFSAALVRGAKLLGFRVTVCDAREAFATPRRFPEADEVVVEWPHRYLEALATDPEIPPLGPRDAVCILTHDPKFDVPAVIAACATEVGYLGAMGSRGTQARREARLRAEGLDDTSLARLHAPIGLDLGAGTPEEVAIAILAEIIAARTGRSAASLRDTTGPITASP